MKNLTETFDKVNATNFGTTTTASGVEHLAQSQRNQMRAELLSSIKNDLATQFENFDIGLTKDGVVVGIPNEDLGVIYVKLNITIPSLDYDFEGETSEYEAALNKRKERQEKKKSQK